MARDGSGWRGRPNRLQAKVSPDKSKARLASPQSRPTSPAYGAGGNSRLLGRLPGPEVVPSGCKFFCADWREFGTRLSDLNLWETPVLSSRCSRDRHGARDRQPCHRFNRYFWVPSHSSRRWASFKLAPCNWPLATIRPTAGRRSRAQPRVETSQARMSIAAANPIAWVP